MNPSSPLRRRFRYEYSNVALWLIAANVLVYAAIYLMPGLGYLLALNPGSVLSGRVWQLLTYAFVHGGMSHLFFNMLGLFFFGTQVERELGSREFLLFYGLAAFLSGLFSLIVYILTGSWNVILLGASGAVYAVLLAFATLFPWANIHIWGILPVRAPVLVIGYAVIELVSQVAGSRGGVAHLTHLAGFGVAYLYFLVRFGVNPARRFFPRR